MSEDCSTKFRKRSSRARRANSASCKPTDFGGFPARGRRASGVLVTRAGLGFTPISRGLLRTYGMELRLDFGGGEQCTANWAVPGRKSDITFVYFRVSSKMVHLCTAETKGNFRTIHLRPGDGR